MNEGDGQIAQGRQELRSRASVQAGAVFAKGDVAHAMGPVFNGTITNDKFCLSRIEQLQPLSTRKLVTQEVNFPFEVTEVKCSPQEETDETTAVECSALQHRNT